MKTIFSLLAVVSLLLFACKKEEDHTRDVTKENLRGTYRYTAASYQIGSYPTINIFDSLDACEKDDLMQLNPALTYNYLDAGTVCNPPGNDTGTWDVVSTTQFKLDGLVFTINSFDGKTLVISNKSTTNTPTTYTMTLVKQ